MDFFRRNLEAAQASAQSLAQQLTDHTLHLAEQASTLSEVAAAQAQEKLRHLSLSVPEQPFKAPFTKPEEGPAPHELTDFGITPDFREFVRSLTYSTFRDFPPDAVDCSSPPPRPASTSGADEASVPGQHASSSRELLYLTPWQERHALLVVQSVKEINELRFVLCPKRMTDELFWRIYFTLARKYLPSEAYDPLYVPPARSPTRSSTRAPFAGFDLHSKLQQLSTSAKLLGAQMHLSSAAGPASSSSQPGVHSLASDLREPLGEELRMPGDSPAWGELDPRAAHSRHATSGVAPDSSAAASDTAVKADSGKDDEQVSELSADADLDAYLRDVLHGDGEGELQKAGGDSQEGSPHAKEAEDDKDDFDKYLKELSDDAGGSAADGEEGSSDELDLDEYMKDMGVDS